MRFADLPTMWEVKKMRDSDIEKYATIFPTLLFEAHA